MFFNLVGLVKILSIRLSRAFERGNNGLVRSIILLIKRFYL